jgi:heme/copper-type cytochrome/quinol oxidase subunit 2
MDNKKKVASIVIIIVVVIVLAGGAFWYWHSVRRAPASGVVGSVGANSTTPSVPSSTTRTAAPVNAVVPDKGSSSTPANVAVPTVQGAGDPAGNVSYRSFNIAIQNGAYNPSTVIVNQGDTVNLELTAVDAAYGFDQPDYGFDVAIPKGKTQTIQFQALSPGSFTFYCASCGGPSKGPVGHIVVVAKQ